MEEVDEGGNAQAAVADEAKSDTLAGLNQLGFHGRERPGRLTQKIRSRLGSDGPQAQLMYDRSSMEICIVLKEPMKGDWEMRGGNSEVLKNKRWGMAKKCEKIIEGRRAGEGDGQPSGS